VSNVPASTPSPRPVQSGGAAPTEQPQIVEFPAGIPGFETCRRFVLLAPAELAPLRCLQALDPPEASFLVVDPTLLDPKYDLTLREFERVRLGAGAEPLLWLAIVTVDKDGASANLRAPVVINPHRMVGCQFIRDDHDYPVHFSLSGA
jgi:flagellar assembly factor FliW